jgi:carbon storage regulator CsrA
MLVLSRRLQEKILFPAIDATVQVVAIKPGVVRLGVEAPSEVVVLREEVVADTKVAAHAAHDPLREVRHAVRNRLNAAGIGLALLRRQIQAGLLDASAQTVQRIDEEFAALLRQVEQTGRGPGVHKPAAKTARRPRRALLVEDDPNERELLAGLLRIHGIDVATAGDGCDALDHLRKIRPDVVLLDMMLPRCDGPTMVRHVRGNPALSDLKIFALSGHPPERFRLEPGAGVDGWFNKPLNPEEFIRHLRRALDNGRATDGATPVTE